MSPDARRRRERLVLLALGLTCLLMVALFMTVGARGAWSFVLPFRGAKVLAMALVGTAIAASTVLFHTLTGNRILTPSIMGFDALYALIQTVLVFALGSAAVARLDPQLLFSGEVALMVLLSTLFYLSILSGRLGSLHLLVLVGVVCGTIFRSISGLLQRLIDPNEFMVLQDRLFASFNAVEPTLLLVSTLLVVTLLAWLGGRAARLDVMGLGRTAAISLGIDHRRETMRLLVAVSILVAVSTALVGPVTFLGLLVANLAYLLTGSHRHGVNLAAASLLAVLTLLGGQLVLERVFGFDTALSIVIEFVGGIVFLFLLVRGLRR